MLLPFAHYTAMPYCHQGGEEKCELALDGASLGGYSVHIGYIHNVQNPETEGSGERARGLPGAKRDAAKRHRGAPGRRGAPAPPEPRRRKTTGRDSVDIIVSNASDKPIYEQIASQMKGLILSGALDAGTQLPSIRALANDLRVSVITTKRAYTDLEAQGFIETVQGKGSFVAGGNMEVLREERLRRVEEHLTRAVDEAKAGGIAAGDLHDMLDLLLED